MGRCGKTEREAGLTTFREYMLLRDGKDAEWKERMELARWVCFNLYQMNPYIKPPRAVTAKSYVRFPWEEVTEAEAKEAAERCQVTQEEQDKLNEIFASIMKNREGNRNG